MAKAAYTTPQVIVHGKVSKLTLGSRWAFEDAWLGVSGTDGLVGPKCDRKDGSKYDGKWWYACGS